jgi:hypothetical protein
MAVLEQNGLVKQRGKGLELSGSGCRWQVSSEELVRVEGKIKLLVIMHKLTEHVMGRLLTMMKGKQSIFAGTC